MKLDLTLGLIDRPGQLIKALEPLAKNGGNIISIIHEREKVSSGYVPVSLVVDFPTIANFEKTKRELEDVSISVIKSEEIIEKANVSFILIGKLDVRKIVETETEKARIVNFESSAPTSKEACIRLNIEAPVEEINRIVAKLKEVAEEENAVLISSV
jgi:ACT domain-containing protein